METKTREINKSQREVDIFVDKEDVESKFQEAYKKAQPGIDVKGFRKGKVPVNVIKKMYGPKIESEALEEMSNTYFQDYLKEEKVSIVGSPKLSNIKKEEDQYHFVISYEIIPEFELADYKNLKIKEPVHNVGDDEIEEQIKLLCRNNGDLQDAEEITDSLFVADVKLQPMDKENMVPIVGSKEEKTKIFLDDDKIMPEMREKLIGMKVGDSFNFEPAEFDPNAPDQIFKVVVEGAKKLVPAELTDEFVQEYTKGAMKTTEEFKEEVGNQIQAQWNEKSKREMEDEIISKLVEMNDLEAPSSIVENVSALMAEDVLKKYKDSPGIENLGKDTIAQDLKPLAEKTVKWEIIRDRIINKEEINVDDFDLDGIAEVEANRLNSEKEAIKSKIKENKQIMDKILSNKLIEVLIGYSETEEIDFEEYEKQKQEERQAENLKAQSGEGESKQDSDSNIITP